MALNAGGGQRRRDDQQLTRDLGEQHATDVLDGVTLTLNAETIDRGDGRGTADTKTAQEDLERLRLRPGRGAHQTDTKQRHDQKAGVLQGDRSIVGVAEPVARCWRLEQRRLERSRGCRTSAWKCSRTAA